MNLDLLELYMPGIGKVLRVPNRLRKGYLKKSSFNLSAWASVKQPQGEKEKARRLRQIERGIIKR